VKVAIVKYNAGNTASVANSLERIGVDAEITDDPTRIANADKVIFPGVGEAASAMQYLRDRKLDDVMRALAQPVLGICLGMQLLCASSEENDARCLGVMPYVVTKFRTREVKIPHVGWNKIVSLQGPLFQGVAEGSYVYFVHSYFVEACESASALCDHAGEFTAALSFRNYHAVQFHPEKSGVVGERILENFLNL
jgi:glutamine amidotransferase